MAKKRPYDESSVLSALDRAGKVRIEQHVEFGDVHITLHQRAGAVIGIHTLGKLDYLLHHCRSGKYSFIPFTGGLDDEEDKAKKKKTKKQKKVRDYERY